MKMWCFLQGFSRFYGFTFSVLAGGFFSQAMAQPRIDTLSPLRGKIRDSLTIQGAHFSAQKENNVVWFGGVRAPVVSASGTELQVNVPAGVSYGPVGVAVDGLSGWSSQFFSSALPTVGSVDANAFGPYIALPVGGNQEQVIAGDLDGDGRVELVTVRPAEVMVTILPNLAQPESLSTTSFAPRIDLPAGGNPMAAALEDLDADGKLDLVLATDGGMLSVYRNIYAGGALQAGSFAARLDFPSMNTALRSLALGDLDGDGKPDVVIGSANRRLTFMRNVSTAGMIQFETPFILSAGGAVVTLALGDINGDRRLDVLTCNNDVHNVSIYRNSGGTGPLSPATFEGRFDLGGGYYPFGMALADLDNDGKLDLALNNSQGGDLYLYRNVGGPGVHVSATFGSRVVIPSAVGTMTLAAGDVNGDGKMDLATVNHSQHSISLFLNQSSGPGLSVNTFGPRLTYPAGSMPRAMLLTDVDGDGKLDMVTARQGGGQLSVLPNNLQAPKDPPIIETHPLSQTVPSGATLALSVVALGSDPIEYQWRFNGTNLPGATSREFMLPNAQPAHSGTYSVRVSNPAGALVSADAVVVVNTAPLAQEQAVATSEDSHVEILLTGTDPDNQPLTYSVGAPVYGRLAGVPPTLIYYPAPNFHGADAFTFRVSDGIASSEAVTVNLTVAPVNDAPTAQSQNVSLGEDVPLSLTLAGSDVDGDTLTYVVGQPQHGTLTGEIPHLVYTPQPNYTGPDAFTFSVSDGTAASPAATVSLNVTPSNDPPLALPQSLSVSEDSSISVTLAGVDMDGDALGFVVGQPEHGTLSGVPPQLVYTPHANYFGTDAFTFQVSDGVAVSAVGTISLSVTPVNDSPVAHPQGVSTSEDSSVSITLTGSDIDNDTLSFAVGQPEHGTLSGVAPNLVYTPHPNYSGPDAFTFTVQDGEFSTSATITLNVQSVNDAPVGRFTLGTLHPLPSSPERPVVLARNGKTAKVMFNASGSSDLENDALQFSWQAGENPPFATGVEASAFFPVGTHTVTLEVSDGKNASRTAVSFEVVAPSDVVNSFRSLVETAQLSNKAPILESLDAAATSFDQDNYSAACGQLNATRNKLRSQMAPADPRCAAVLTDAIDRLVNEVQRN